METQQEPESVLTPAWSPGVFSGAVAFCAVVRGLCARSARASVVHRKKNRFEVLKTLSCFLSRRVQWSSRPLCCMWGSCVLGSCRKGPNFRKCAFQGVVAMTLVCILADESDAWMSSKSETQRLWGLGFYRAILAQALRSHL